MLVYRVEHSEDGIGPYNRKANGGIWQWAGNSFRHYKLPEPRQESQIANDPRYTGMKGLIPWVCGFSSVHRLAFWFDPTDRVNLHKLGYHIVIYEIERDYVIVGSLQCIFVREFAKKIGQHSLVGSMDIYENTGTAFCTGISERVPGGEDRGRAEPRQGDVGSPWPDPGRLGL